MAALRFCGVTPAFFKILPASLSLSSASPSSSRSTVTNESPAFSPAFSAASNTRASAGARWSAPAPPPSTFGRFASAASTARKTSRELPPARSISPLAKPSGSSSRTFSRCSGANCWCPSRKASDWADCTKPRARSVYFSRFIPHSLGLSRPPRRRNRNIVIGFSPPDSKGTRRLRYGSHHGSVKGVTPVFHGRLARSLAFVNKARMAVLKTIYRYPVKGLSPEALPRVRLEPGQTLPADRRYAIENGPSGFDPAAPSYLPKSRFLMLMRNERLAQLDTGYDDATQTLGIRHGGREAARGDLSTGEGRLAIEAFIRRFMPDELRGPPKVLQADGHSFSDVAAKVVSLINRASVAAIETMVGAPVHHLRFRANLYVDGWPAWHEFDLLGQEIAIGDARLKVAKRITRCAATAVDPDTGVRDLAIPDTLLRKLDHADCGIYAQVIAGGEIEVGDTVSP